MLLKNVARERTPNLEYFISFSAAQTENFPLELLESNYNILETFPKYQIEDENLMVLSIAANIEVIWVSCSLALRT